MSACKVINVAGRGNEAKITKRDLKDSNGPLCALLMVTAPSFQALVSELVCVQDAEER